MNTPLDLRLDESTRIGAFSRVFLDEAKNCVYKLFKSDKFGQLFSYDGEPVGDAKRRAIFKAEVEAFEMANGSEELRPLVAQFLGLRSVRSVCDGDGVDKSEAFLLDQCYALELLQGEDEKFDNSQNKAKIHCWEGIRIKFEQFGIRVCDASFFLTSGGVKLIDITTKNPCEE